MTRFLSESLRAGEPSFRMGLRQLEYANDRRGADIKLSNEIRQATADKLLELGLDPRDTTPNELFRALHERIKSDDARMTKTLRTLAATHVSAEGDVIDGIVHAI